MAPDLNAPAPRHLVTVTVTMVTGTICAILSICHHRARAIRQIQSIYI
jgi:hypothetical protein